MNDVIPFREHSSTWFLVRYGVIPKAILGNTVEDGNSKL